MNEINLKLKSYNELIFEITTLNTNKYLLEQKLNKQKEVLDKVKPMLKELNIKLKDILNIGIDIKEISDILELLEEIK